MKELKYDGNIFLLPEKKALHTDACIVTTNGIVRRDGRAVMGAGIARYCRDTFSGVDRMLGDELKRGGNHAYCLGNWMKPDGTGSFLLFSFPTKDDWKDASKAGLIRQSCKEVMALADEQLVEAVYMPCPGCSNGRLDYWKDVRGILLEELDDRFMVCIPDAIMKGQ